MKKFYTAKTDRVFKAIFCSEENKHMMIKLLSSILEREVTELTFLNNELSIDNKKYVSTKYSYRTNCYNCRIILR